MVRENENREEHFIICKSYTHICITFLHNQHPLTGTCYMWLYQILQCLIEKHCHQGTQPRVDTINDTLIDFKIMGSQPHLYIGDTMALLPRFGTAAQWSQISHQQGMHMMASLQISSMLLFLMTLINTVFILLLHIVLF